MSYKIGLVLREGLALAWLLDLPGCVVGGRDGDEIVAKLPRAIADHRGWLRAHGEAVGGLDEWEFIEVVTGTAGDVVFEAEQEAIPANQMERLIGHVEFARDDLLAALDNVPEAVLDWEPPRSAFTSFDPWALEVRTIRDVAQHVYQFEVYYREGLRDGPAAGIYEAIPDPVVEHVRTIHRLRSLTDGERCRVWRPLRPGQIEPEEWTARKVLRRMISHERAHSTEIIQRQTWAWVSLGIPH